METTLHPPGSSDPAAPSDSRLPWIGLSPYTWETRRFFFGRDAEIADIFVRVREQPLTILYGQSGLGKSSLLRAGLEPRLRDEGLRPAVIRLRFDELAPPLPVQLGKALDQALDTAPGEGPAVTIWERLHHLATRHDDLAERPPVLIVDQFEEIFTLGVRAGRQEEVATFFQELAQAVENRPPAALQEAFEADRRLAREYDFAPGGIRFVLTLREDYLFGLDEWKKELPSLMRNRAPLRLLSGPQALEAVVRPGSLDGPPLVSPEVAADIVCFVADKPRGTPLDSIGAVPPLLSLVCERLNEDRIRRGETTITADQVEAQSGSILDQFYEESFAGHPLALRHFVEDELVTERGHRAPFSREDAEDLLRREGLSDPGDALDSLLKRRLITAEERGGIPWIEITHDVLAPLVVKSRDERLERERADAERRRAETIEKERRRLRRIAAAFAVLALLAVAGMIFGWVKTREAGRERDAARHNEGLAWMLRASVAEKEGNRYPDTLLYAAQAIGFEGVGRPAHLGAGEEPVRYIRSDRNEADYRSAREWIADRPAYRPIWSSANRPEAPATDMAADPSGRWIALGSESGVRLFDLQNVGQENQLPDLSGVNGLAFLPDGKTLAISTAKGVRKWMVDEARTETVSEEPVGALAWSPGGDLLAGAGEAGSILLWKAGEGEPQVIPAADEGNLSVNSLAFSPENGYLAGVAPGAGPRIWFPDHRAAGSAWVELNAEEETMARVDKRDQDAFRDRVAIATTTTSVAVSPDERTLAAGTRETDESVAGETAIRGSVVLWDAASATIRGRVSPEQRHGDMVTTVVYRPDGRQLASGAGDGTIKLWSVTGAGTLRLVATLTGHRGAVTQLIYGPGGSILASAGSDGTAKLWDVSGDKPGSLDLFAYRASGWYELTPNLGWQTGAVSGFLDESAEELAANWRLPEEPAADRIMVLLAKAEQAAGENRWRKVKLLAQQLEQLGAVLPPRIVAALRAATEPHGERAGDLYINGDGMALVWCPATGPKGFQMGSPESEKDKGRDVDETLHAVILTSGFWMGETEVTQEQWERLMGHNPATYADDPSKPVEMVSWEEAMEFCRRLTDRERARGALPPGWNYTLPTEAQWEYACRAGTSTAWSFGDDAALFAPLDPARPKYGNFKDDAWSEGDQNQDDGETYTAKVKSYRPNPWGLYDMHGNVWEWCRDWYQEDFYSEGQVDPEGPLSGVNRVNRGGSWDLPAAICRSAVRFRIQPGFRYGNLGFRVAAVPSLSHPEEKQQAKRASDEQGDGEPASPPARRE